MLWPLLLACLGLYLVFYGSASLLKGSLLWRGSFLWREHGIGLSIDIAIIVAGCLCFWPILNRL